MSNKHCDVRSFYAQDAERAGKAALIFAVPIFITNFAA